MLSKNVVYLKRIKPIFKYSEFEWLKDSVSEQRQSNLEGAVILDGSSPSLTQPQDLSIFFEYELSSFLVKYRDPTLTAWCFLMAPQVTPNEHIKRAYKLMISLWLKETEHDVDLVFNALKYFLQRAKLNELKYEVLTIPEIVREIIARSIVQDSTYVMYFFILLNKLGVDIEELSK